MLAGEGIFGYSELSSALKKLVVGSEEWEGWVREVGLGLVVV